MVGSGRKYGFKGEEVSFLLSSHFLSMVIILGNASVRKRPLIKELVATR